MSESAPPEIVLSPDNLNVHSESFPPSPSESKQTARMLYWVGATLGGFTLATVSAVVMWVAEKKIPNGKTVGRDVILGVVLFFLLLQLLPESTTALVTAIMSIITFSSITVPAAGSVIDTISSVTAMDEMEVRVGVPKF